MKVKIEIEYDIEPHGDLNPRDLINLVGAITRLTRNRLSALKNHHVGGTHAKTGWEATIEEIEITPKTKA